MTDLVPALTNRPFAQSAVPTDGERPERRALEAAPARVRAARCQTAAVGTWPEHLPVGALRVVHWSAHYDESVAFYRDAIGLRVLETFRDSYGLDGTILGLPGGPVHLEIVRLAERAAPARGLDQLVFYLPDAAAQGEGTARGRRRPPGRADRLLGGQRRYYLSGPGRARSGVRILGLRSAASLIGARFTAGSRRCSRRWPGAAGSC